jgi:lipoprotein-anchoring transpeptidase ErfK/SrfK
MSTFRVFVVVSCILFGLIFLLALNKKKTEKNEGKSVQQVVDITTLCPKKQEIRCQPKQEPVPTKKVMEQPVATASGTLEAVDEGVTIEHDQEQESLMSLFERGSGCPIVETVTYKSRVAWKPHRPAWLIDYAQHYRTPLSFICRSLTGDENLVPKTISDGVQFNVFRNDIDFRFHAIVSLHSRILRLYYVIPKEKRVVFLRSYSVCVGRKDSSKKSGCLTPVGTFQLGSRVGVFSQGMTGTHKGKKIELIQVFGTHWIPFESEIQGCSEPAKGFGIHGVPILKETGKYEEDVSSLGHFESDGCIRMRGKDIKELFSLISTRKTFVEIVPSFQSSRIFQGEV